jgi:fructose-bisphosphate aldolase class II
MALFPMKELLQDAEARGYGIPAYSTLGGHLGVLRTILRTAEENASPVIIIEGYGDMEYYSDPYWYAEAAKAALKSARVPAALHLDHAFCFSHIVRALRFGFTSVMFDGSRLSYEENISHTTKVVELCHSVGVTVEGELGNVGGLEGDAYAQDDTTVYTDPEQASRFVEQTGIDALAPAVGTCHGLYTREPQLDFPRLKQIREMTDIPLVLHGATGVPLLDMQKAISLGVRKINIATQVRVSLRKGILEQLENHPDDTIEKAFHAAESHLTRFMTEQIAAFGCAGKA